MADDRLAQAVDELYALDPAQFTARRNALASAARKAGAADQAKQISALRRPSRAAWILNQLSRSDPSLASGFAELGSQLRAAHQSLDGTQIRELTRQRRALIDQTAAQAFSVAEVSAPSSALRDEVIETLGAVLADDETAGRFAGGILVTAEDQSGFGPVGAHLVSVPTGGESDASVPVRSAPRTSREQLRREAALAKAEQALAAAAEAEVAGDEAVTAAAGLVRQLTDQLADARRREDDARLDARRAELARQKAEATLAALKA